MNTRPLRSPGHALAPTGPLALVARAEWPAQHEEIFDARAGDLVVYSSPTLTPPKPPPDIRRVKRLSLFPAKTTTP